MSFSCPHFRLEDDHCLRLKTDCVPGRRGCVLAGKTVFATPVEQRIREQEEENRRKTQEKLLESAPVNRPPAVVRKTKRKRVT